MKSISSEEAIHMSVWVVVCYDYDTRPDPCVTVFDNKYNAYKCYSFYLGSFDKVDIKECAAHSEFLPPAPWGETKD